MRSAFARSLAVGLLFSLSTVEGQPPDPVPPGTLASVPTDEADRKAAIRLLDEFWTDDVQTQRDAESYYERQASLPESGGYTAFAFAINRIHFRRLREANTAIVRITPPLADDWDARYTRIWLNMAVGNINEALVQMQSMGDAVRDDATLDKPNRHTILERLGRLYAFAEGPARDKARQATLENALNSLTRNLDDNQLGSFEDQRGQLRNQYTSMVAERDANVADQKAEAAREQARVVDQVSAENKVINERQTAIQAEVTRIRQAAGEELSRLRSDAAPLRSELATLDSRIISARDRAAWIATDIVNFENLAAHEPDPFLRNHYFQQAAGARLSLASQNGFINNLRGQFDVAASQLNVIDREIGGIESRVNGQLAGLSRESSQLTAKLKRNSRTLSRLGEPSGEKGYLADVNARLGHLPTFDPFPVEEIRERLLGELK